MIAKQSNNLMKLRRLLLLALGASLWGHARAQTASASLHRVGVLAPSTSAKEAVTLKPFFDQMRALGWIEGQTIAYDRAYADDRHEDLPRLAAELVARRPELVYAPPLIAARAAWQAARSIPMVFATVSDPVREGFVASLGRPGGNATGLSNISASLLPKRIQLLREILPGLKRIGRLLDPADPAGRLSQQEFAPVAAAMGLTITTAEPANPAEFDAAVAKLVADRVEAIYAGSVLALNMRVRLIELANQKRLPVIGLIPSMADAGALFVYSPSQADLLRRSALVVDKVLKGAKPADIPVEQPTVFELVVNLKAAKALGITIPPAFLLRADRVIE